MPLSRRDNVTISNELVAAEVEWAPKIAAQQRQREEAIANAKTNLVIYDEMTRNLREQLEQRRQAELALTQRELMEYEKLLPAEAAFWETKNNPAETKNVWELVKPQKISATGNVKLTQQSDGSITSSEGKSPSDYVIVASSPLTNITGVMLEVLPDENCRHLDLAGSADGNFVLSELELKWAAGTNMPDNVRQIRRCQSRLFPNRL